jgi:hypothetical protein
VIKSFWFWFWFWVTEKFKYLFWFLFLGEKMSNPTFTGSLNDSGVGAGEKALSVPQDPKRFLKTFWGKRVSIKAKGVFIDDLLDRRGNVLKSEYFIGVLEGKYRVIVDWGEIILRASRHAFAVRQLDFVEINGVRVKGEENE